MEDGASGYFPRYALMRDGAGPAALCIAPRWDSGPLWERLLLRRATRIFAPYSASFTGIATRADVALADVIAPIEAELRSALRPLTTVTVATSAEIPAFRACGYQTLALAPNTGMELVWRTFGDYLEARRPKDRRDHARNLRNLEKRDMVLSSGPADEGEDELYALYLATSRHHGLPRDEPTPFGPSLFRAMARHLGDDARVFRVRERASGRTVLFLLGVADAVHCAMPIAGLDYELGSLAGPYWLLHTEAVRWAIARGARQIHCGTTTYAMKARLGYERVPRWLCYRAPHALLAPLVAGASGWVSQRFGYSGDATHAAAESAS